MLNFACAPLTPGSGWTQPLTTARGSLSREEMFEWHLSCFQQTTLQHAKFSTVPLMPCACLWRIETSARSQPASGHHLSLGSLQASECTRADCTNGKTGFGLQFPVTYLDQHTYYHGRKTVCVFHGFHCLPFSFISTISLYISCKISPGGHCSVVFYTVSLSHIPGNLSLPSPQHLYCLPWEANKHTQVKVQQKSLQILL